MTDLPLPRGVRDLMPNEALFRNELLKKIEKVFQSFGFLTIDTPSIEDLRVLKAKGGIGEDTKQIYEMKDEKIGLRFDNTMSLARYMSMHQHLPLPVQEVLHREGVEEGGAPEAQVQGVHPGGRRHSGRRERPLPMQRSWRSGAAVFEALGFACRTEVNDRRVVDAVLTKLGVPESKVVEA